MDIQLDIPREFSDLVAERYPGAITAQDVRQLVKFLFNNGWMDESKARQALMKDNYFKLIRQGDTAQEAKLTIAVNFDCSYSYVRSVIYNSRTIL